MDPVDKRQSFHQNDPLEPQLHPDHREGSSTAHRLRFFAARLRSFNFGNIPGVRNSNTLIGTPLSGLRRHSTGSNSSKRITTRVSRLSASNTVFARRSIASAPPTMMSLGVTSTRGTPHELAKASTKVVFPVPEARGVPESNKNFGHYRMICVSHEHASSEGSTRPTHSARAY